MPTLTIETTNEHAARVADAFGKALNLVDGEGVPRPASAAEIKQQTILFLKQVVHDQERRAAVETAESGLIAIEPT